MQKMFKKNTVNFLPDVQNSIIHYKFKGNGVTCNVRLLKNQFKLLLHFRRCY